MPLVSLYNGSAKIKREENKYIFPALYNLLSLYYAREDIWFHLYREYVADEKFCVIRTKVAFSPVLCLWKLVKERAFSCLTEF